MDNISIYIHWPFCKSKCPYCDFNSHVRERISQEDFLQAYLKEIEYYSPYFKNKKVNSVFFGGGTPSLMDAQSVYNILQKIDNISSLKDCEITLEANPTSIESEKFKDFKNAGINRISLGIQSLKDEDLKFLGREHSAIEAKKAINITAKIFDNFSFDMIYARPKQQLDSWIKELKEALSFNSPHLSLYQLTIEKGTPFYSIFKNKKFTMLDEDTLAIFYETTSNIMSLHNLNCYEVSNYAMEGFECQHNLNYWNYGEYIGIGAGAHGRIKDLNNTITATMNIHHPENWLKQASNNFYGLQEQNILTPEESLEEALLFGFRLTNGINKKKFYNIFGQDISSLVNKTNLDSLTKEGFIENSDSYISLTSKGFLLSNMIITKLLEK